MKLKKFTRSKAKRPKLKWVAKGLCEKVSGGGGEGGSGCGLRPPTTLSRSQSDKTSSLISMFVTFVVA
jgi:hypothetical protein